MEDEMCGRFTLTIDPADLRDAFPGLTFPDAERMAPRYNIAPSQLVAVVANDGKNAVEFFKWGLVPSWAQDPEIGNRMINARAESLAEKPSFRAAYKRRRCLVLADGFYEWKPMPGSKTNTPMLIKMKSGEPFAFAGLWEPWHPDQADALLSCTIITTTPNALMEKIHNRMPVILKPEAYPLWLDPSEQTPDKLDKLLKPYPASQMAAFPVSRLVNDPKNDSPDCIKPA
jgi:putative SOS response-associated peptidase YedK